MEGLEPSFVLKAIINKKVLQLKAKAACNFFNMCNRDLFWCYHRTMKKILFFIFCFLSKLTLIHASDFIFDQNPDDNLESISTLQRTHGIKLFWWNVAWGRYNSDQDLDKNIVALIKSELSPDILSFTEFKNEILNSKTLEALNSSYPHQFYQPLFENASVGIKTFSKFPITKIKTSALDWAPAYYSDKDKATYRKEWMDFDQNSVQYWDRTYVLLKVKTDNFDFFISPTHLCSPWESYLKRYGKLKTLRAVKSGYDNPLQNQIDILKNNLVSYFGQQMNNFPLIFFGDFNIPSDVPVPFFGGAPKSYKELRSFLSIGLKNDKHTFPSESTRNQQPDFLRQKSVLLDHVFYNSKIRMHDSRVLQFKGSDHYPFIFYFN